MLQRFPVKASRLVGMVVVWLLLAALFALPALSQALADTPPWMDTSLPAEERARLLLEAMTTDEKVAMVYGNHMGSAGYVGHVPEISRLHIPELVLQDGPAGVAGAMRKVTAFPAPITVAASWDTALMEQYGVAMAEEQRAKGVNVLLGPMMNIVRVPVAGRNFEGYGEDPYLSAQMAAASVRGIQSTGVIATAKHYIANEQEFQRTTFSSEIDVRTLHEIYLPPFEASVQAGVGSVMCSYNLINGIYACENPDTQNTILKEELGFTGWIMSDWGATHSLIDSALGGLDMEMPSGVHYVELGKAIEAGDVPISRLDDMVMRILVPMFRMGLFDRGSTGSISVDAQTDAHTKFARDAAAQSFVLLKNDNAALPLDPAVVRSIAVFGLAAGEEPIIVGGGSGSVTPSYSISPLQGITGRAGDTVDVRYFTISGAVGQAIPAEVLRAPGGAAGLQAEYFDSPDLSGSPALVRTDETLDFDWKGEAPAESMDRVDWSARWSVVVTPQATGLYNLALTSAGASRLYIDDKLAIDNPGERADEPVLAKRRFTAGQPHTLRVEYSPADGASAIRLTWFTPDDDPNQEAAALAGQVDAAIVVVGSASSEGADRQTLSVSNQPLIDAVAKVNDRTIVVVYNPAQVLLPWSEQVAAILIGWIPGQEAGNALADVLFGDVNPSGKLPLTYARNESDYPANTPETYPGVDGRVLYSEGLRVGYRHFDNRDIEPLYEFGYGLSYTTFEYSNLTINPTQLATHDGVTITVDVKNIGQRAGAEVAQLYLGFPAETSEPPRQLKGFEKVVLEPGEAKRVTFTLLPEAFSFWSAGLGTWVAYPGTYQVMVGSSSRRIRQDGTFEVQGGPLVGAPIEAETATLVGSAAVATDQAGYTGSGFVSGLEEAGAAVSFTVTTSEAGKYLATLRYASMLRPGEQNTPRTLSLYVNGSRVGQTDFPNLANWELWDFKPVSADLKAGDNTITYQVDAGDTGDIHLDGLVVTKAVEPTPTPSPADTTPAPAATGSTGWLIGLAIVVVMVGVLVALRRRAVGSRK